MSTTALAGVSALGTWPWRLQAADADSESRPFRFDDVIANARSLAGRPYKAPEPRYDDLLDNLGYESFMGVHANRERSLWHDDDDLPVTVEFFHLDQNARQPITIYAVDENRRVRKITYDPGLFRYDDPELAERLPDDLGFAGFRVRATVGDRNEWCAFKGASYFRSPGELNQYGLSARGVAVNTGYGKDEAFPNFTTYWLLQPKAGDDTLTVCALLEGAHLTGAYRFRISAHGTVMDIESRLFQRADIKRLGIAPITSMFWFNETNGRRGIDWRPEIHDSDGLAMTTGAGERLWRALDNPPQTHFSAFSDENPRGFGLLQRDRDFDHYQDADVRYERRPSLWVEPRGDWGRGHVGLLELATDEEVYDNINVFWMPAAAGHDGKAWRFDYRLYWCDEAPDPPEKARVVATRTGRAGGPGTYENQSVLARKFVLDFEGGDLASFAEDAKLEVQAEASHGRIVNPYATRVNGTSRWRAFFDWSGELPPEDQPVELRCVMALGERVLTETWLFAYFPQPLPQRVSSTA